MQLKLGYLEMVKRAEAEIQTLTPAVALERQRDGNAVIVDLRDIREIQREGRIPGSLNVPRGMLEFWVDPDSPYHNEIFASGRPFIFHCSKGWRSALSTQTVQTMGLPTVAHIGGGYEAWVAEGLPTEALPAK